MSILHSSHSSCVANYLKKVTTTNPYLSQLYNTNKSFLQPLERTSINLTVWKIIDKIKIVLLNFQGGNMNISYNINSFNDFKKLPLICRCSIIISYLSVVIAILYIPLSGFLNNKFLKEHNFFIYGFIMFIVSFITTILFDKNRNERIKVGIMKRPPF